MAHTELTIPQSINNAHGSITSSAGRLLREGTNSSNFLSSVSGFVVESLSNEIEVAANELSTFIKETGAVSQRSVFFYGRIQEEINEYNQRAHVYLADLSNSETDTAFVNAQQTANTILSDIGVIMGEIAVDVDGAIDPFQGPSESVPAAAVPADLLSTLKAASGDASAALTPGPQAALIALGSNPTGNADIDGLAGPLSQGIAPIDAVKQKTSNATTQSRILAARTAAQNGISEAENNQSKFNNQIPPLLNNLAGLLL